MFRIFYAVVVRRGIRPNPIDPAAIRMVASGMVPLFFLLVLLIAPAGAPAQDTWNVPAFAVAPGKMVDVGGFRLNLYCFGDGQPTIILESGASWGAIAWAGIQQTLAEQTKARVCSYDRAGINFSDSGPLKPAPDANLRNLRELLNQASLPGPYLLVGWSYGGMIARWFASVYPQDTAGIVTVDGSDWDYAVTSPNYEGAIEAMYKCRGAAKDKRFDRDPKLLEQCASLLNATHFYPPMRAALLDNARDPDRYSQWIHTMERTPDSTEAIRKSRRPLGALPMRLLLAGADLEQGTPGDVRFIQRSMSMAKLSTDGLITIVPGARHMIHNDRPWAVVRTIEEIVPAIRSRKR